MAITALRYLYFSTCGKFFHSKLLSPVELVTLSNSSFPFLSKKQKKLKFRLYLFSNSWCYTRQGFSISLNPYICTAALCTAADKLPCSPLLWTVSVYHFVVGNHID